MITIFKRGRNYWIDCSYDGKRVRRSLKTRDPKIAERRRQAAELEVHFGKAVLDKTLSEYRDEFLRFILNEVRPRTVKSYSFVVNRFVAYAEANQVFTLNKVQPQFVSDFATFRSNDRNPKHKGGRPMTDGGHRFDFRVIKRFFNYAVECGYIERSPVKVRNIGSIGGTTQPFSDAEVRKMLCCPWVLDRPRMYAIIMVLLGTGLRVGDVRDLQKADVSSSHMILKTRKRGTVVSLPIRVEVQSAINKWLGSQNAAQTSSPYLFPSEQGKPIRSFENVLAKMFKQAGIVKGHAHRFRDTYSVALLRSGASLFDVSKLLGVSYTTAEKHYAPFTNELKERARKIVEGAQLFAVGSPANVPKS